MPLDDDVRRYLEEQARLAAPLAWEVPLAQARAAHAERHLTAGEGVTVAKAEDGTLAGSTVPVPIRSYWPDADAKALRVLVYLHGGGFVFGDIATHDVTARRLAHDTGSLVVSVEYPLAPEHPFPAAVENSEAALLELIPRLAAMGGSQDRLILAGDSAGANLATVLTRRLRDRNGPLPAGQLLVYPVTDFREVDYPSRRENGSGYGLTAQAMEWFGRNYLPDEAHREDPDVSPLAAPDLAGLPPALVLTAEFDPLRDEGEEYARRLREAGAEVECHRLAGTIHGILTTPQPLRSRERAWELLTGWVERF